MGETAAYAHLWIAAVCPAWGAWLWGAACAFLLALLIAAFALDARTRKFPNRLALALAAAALSLGVFEYGPQRVPLAVGGSFAFLMALAGFEAWWRRCHGGAAGLGLGDVKFVAALCLWRPLAALCALALGLCLLAVCGLALRRPTLPLLPFVVPTYLLVVAPAML